MCFINCSFSHTQLHSSECKYSGLHPNFITEAFFPQSLLKRFSVKVKVRVLCPIQQPGSYCSPLSLVGGETHTEVTACDQT